MRLAAAGPRTDRQVRRSNASQVYMPSRTTSVAHSAEERRAVCAQDRSRPIVDDLEPWLRAKLILISQKTKPRRGDPLCARRAGMASSASSMMAASRSIPTSWNATSAPIALNRKNRAVRRLRWRRRTLGGRRFADRNLQTQRHRSARLSSPT